MASGLPVCRRAAVAGFASLCSVRTGSGLPTDVDTLCFILMDVDDTLEGTTNVGITKPALHTTARNQFMGEPLCMQIAANSSNYCTAADVRDASTS